VNDKTSKITIVTLAAGILTCCVLAFAAVACSGESSAEAKTNFCSSLSNFSGTVMSYQGMNVLTASTDELESAANDIDAAYNDVIDEANDWANAYDNPLTEAYNDLYWALDDVDGDATVAETINEVDDELDAIPAAYAETFDGSGC
jgi:hypothetical protein